MAEAFPQSRFVGFDFHEPSIQEARQHAREHKVDDRVRFEAVTAKDIRERDFDLVTMFDCLHDMGDPRGCASHIRRIIKDDGTWMLVEPLASDNVAENLNPVGRLYYNASTMICVPTSLDQEVGAALGAQAGQAKLTEMVGGGGFSKVRRATEGPFNMVLEARI
jgi:ubiquinone/menaquinone biosynthesis C-methylase UbiE